jgi:outer membrane receptor protein involved in Fe transport
MPMKNARISLKAIALGSCALGALMAAASPAAAEEFAVSAQDLRPALQLFATQGDQQVLFSSAAVAGKRTAGFTGEASPETALQQLLSGTDLVYSRTAEDALLVMTQQEAQANRRPQLSSAAPEAAGGDQGTVQALIVTAQKREENIQDVPIAMSAFTQEDLTRSQVAGGPDLMTQVPNFTFTKTNFSSYSIQIRGIGTQAISATTDAAVAVAFNNTPFIRNRFFEQEFYDLQRVEVLRGPQGTLYGRNATAGVVNIISQKPKFTYEARLSADVGNYSSQRFEGMVNVPLVDDKVALRLAGAWTKRDGYDTNQITGNQIDGRDLWSTRLSLRFAPTDHIEANLIWEHFNEDDDRLRSGKQLCHQDDRDTIAGHNVPPINGYSALFSQGCLASSLYSPDSFEAPNGLSLPYYLPLGAIFLPVKPGFNPYASLTQSPDLRTIESTVDPHYRAKSDVVELQWSVDLGQNLTLTSETGYDSDFIFSTQDFNRFNTAHGAFQDTLGTSGDREGVLTPGEFGGIFCDPQIGCADRVVAVDLSTARSRQFSQEFRVASNYDGPFNFSLGANFLRYDTEDKYYVFINTLSLYAAVAPYGGITALQGMGPMPAWQANVSDNHECLIYGNRAPNPAVFNSVIGCVYVDPNPIGSLNDQGHNYFLSRNPYKLISYAVFGEAYYNITPNLKLTAGLRWTVDKKEAPRIPSWVLAAGTVGYPVQEVVRQEWREPTGRLTLDWKPDLSFTDETLLYASYSHGYKAGGTNPPPAGPVGYGSDVVDAVINSSVIKPKTFDPEFVNAFEVGSKNTMLGGKVTVNADAFYYDYTGYQISQIIDRSAVNYNFDAKVWGLEFEGDWRPLENFHLGLKVGYEKTRVADGSRAIDIMDRTAGNPDWVVVRPFPTQTSNCIVPLNTVVGIDGSFTTAPNVYVNGNAGPCEDAYLFNLDPVTGEPYSSTPTVPFNFPSDYPGYDPTVDVGQNHGEGFFKNLSGHELPNAPHYTATLTADYTLPLPSDWLMTLHTDLYYQSEAWTRIFNTPGYDKLKAYNNVNFAAIFTNEDAGWKVMAYVKNVFDKDNITGAFLNSDDTGLTTNVFLNEPRLYGLRVTKEWNGGPWWTGANSNHAGPYPLTVEIAGQVQRQDGPYATMEPDFATDGTFSNALNTLPGAENRNLDWGDGRELRITYRPAGSLWTTSAAVRYSRTNGGNARVHTEEDAGTACAFTGKYSPLCDPAVYTGIGASGVLRPTYNWSDVSVTNREDHLVADFAVGRDMGIGAIGLDRSSVSAGLRYARFNSKTSATIDGIPDYNLPDGWFGGKYNPTLDHYSWSAAVHRDFKGAGPVLSWDASGRLLGNEDLGHVDFDWSVTGGVLFGKQNMSAEGTESSFYWTGLYRTNPRLPATPVTPTPISIHRTKSVSAPVLDLSLGLSYEIQRVKVGAGYRWERYYNVLDAGYAERKSYDRTFDGPYFKIAVGFGG